MVYLIVLEHISKTKINYKYYNYYNNYYNSYNYIVNVKQQIKPTLLYLYVTLNLLKNKHGLTDKQSKT